MVTNTNKHLKDSLLKNGFFQRSSFNVSNTTRSNFGSKHQQLLGRTCGFKISYTRQQCCTALQGHKYNLTHSDINLNLICDCWQCLNRRNKGNKVSPVLECLVLKMCVIFIFYFFTCILHCFQFSLPHISRALIFETYFLLIFLLHGGFYLG